MNRPTLIFLHIPKAAGSTLGRIVHREYQPGPVWQSYPSHFPKLRGKHSALESARRRYAHFETKSKAERAQVKAFMGHEGFGFHTLFPQQTTYITMLRDPVDRVLSYYYYLHQSPKNRMYDKVVGSKMSLEAFVSSDTSNELDNVQTKFLAGLETPYLRHGAYGDELLEKAKQNIEGHFCTVGFTERFDESLIMFKRQLHWSMPYYVRANVTKKRHQLEEVPAPVLQVIEEKNALDISLYHYAAKRFDAEMAGQHNKFVRELHLFKCLNMLYGVLHKSRKRIRAKMT